MKTFKSNQLTESKEKCAATTKDSILSLQHNQVWNVLVRICEIVKFEIINNLFFTISLFTATVSSFFNTPQWGYIDGKVIVCLFELMLVVKAFEEYGLLGHVAVKIVNHCKDERQLTQSLCIVSFFLSMFITNDVAILTVIPILIAISRKYDLPIILPCILVTMAANLGSSMTPIGNPQNLYLFSFYKMSIFSFFSNSFSLCLVSILLLIAFSFLIKPKKMLAVLSDVPITEGKRISAFIVLSILAIFSVVGMIPYVITLLIVIPATIILNRQLLRKLDYRLLLTFLFLFIAIGNISHIPLLREQMSNFTSTPFKTYVSALLLSQIISNVPSAIMLAPFTSHIHALFYGVNIGGLGTPVASLASIIAFSLFYREYPLKKRRYLADFLLLNFSLLIILGSVFIAVILL